MIVTGLLYIFSVISVTPASSLSWLWRLSSRMRQQCSRISTFQTNSTIEHQTGEMKRKRFLKTKYFSGTQFRSIRLCGRIMEIKLNIFLLFRICYGHITELSVWLIYFSCKPFIKRISISLDTNLPTYLDYYQQFGITQLGRKI